MSARTAFWHETRRITAQWVGLALASIISGVLLGMLLRQGTNERLALEIALPVGFLLALLFWIWSGRRFSTSATRITVPVPLSPTSLNFEGQATITAYPYQVAPIVTLAYQDPRLEGAPA